MKYDLEDQLVYVFTPKGDIYELHHFDMYRISDGDDLYSTGYDEYVETDGYCIAEWSENVEDFLPENAIFVTVSRVDGDPDGRRIDIE